MRIFTVLGLWILSVTPAAHADWKVGLPVCVTTSCAVEGDNSVKGAQMAADELNAAGGVLGQKVVLVIEDTAEGTAASQAVSAYRKLRTDPQIQYFIGPNWTGAGLAIAPIAAKENVVVTSPSLGVKDFSAAGVNLFNVNGPDEVSSRFLAQLAIQKGWKRAAIFSSQHPWDSAQGSFFEEEFIKRGGTIVAKVEPIPDAPDVRAEALKIATSKPDVVLFSNLSAQITASLKRLTELDYSGPRFAVWLDDTIVERAQGAVEGAISCRVTEPKPWFVERFKAKYGANPERASYGAYDTVMIYANAITAAQSFEPKAVIPILAKTKHDGASGAFAFDSIGDAVRTPALKIVSGGRLVPVSAQ